VTGHRPSPDVPAQAKALKVALFPVLMEGAGVRRLRSNHPHVVETLEMAL